jgi:hypothetical protein
LEGSENLSRLRSLPKQLLFGRSTLPKAYREFVARIAMPTERE